jgi:hypothetical protein
VNQQELNHIIQHPHEITAASASELIALCEKYPWFSAPHTLLAHYFARTNDFRKEEWLTQAASRIHNREWLYYFLQPVSDEIPEVISVNQTMETMAAEPAAVIEPFEPSIPDAEPVNTAPELEIVNIEPAIATQVPNTQSENSNTELSIQQIPEWEFQTPKPLFQPAEEYDIAKAMGTTFNFEPVEFIQNNQATESIDQPKQTRPYNLEEFLSLGLINNNETEESKGIEANPSDTKPDIEELNFFDWLERKNTIATGNRETAETNKPANNLDKFGLINQFIEKQPSISRPKQEFYSPERAMKRSEEFSTSIVTETLANIFRTQGHLEKAIISYEKLQLKFPEKSAYFASLIEQIKKEQNQ